jgi:hypothetical protein
MITIAYLKGEIMRRKIWILSFLLMVPFVMGSAASGAEYLGANQCKGCHMDQFKSWQQTEMANSFESLKPGIKADAKKKAGLDPDKDYTADKNCLKCHTTGYGKPGGFKSLAETPDLINVQCEGCHGPGVDFRKVMMKSRDFKLSEAVSAGLFVPSEKVNNCTECHNAESPFNEKVDAKYKFDIKEALKKTHEHLPLKYQH